MPLNHWSSISVTTSIKAEIVTLVWPGGCREFFWASLIVIIECMSYQVRGSSHCFWVKHDNLRGHMTLHSLCHLLHSTVDGWVLDLKPVVCIPANEEPNIFLPVQFLLVNLHTDSQRKRVNLKFNSTAKEKRNEKDIRLIPSVSYYINKLSFILFLIQS